MVLIWNNTESGPLGYSPLSGKCQRAQITQSAAQELPNKSLVTYDSDPSIPQNWTIYLDSPAGTDSIQLMALEPSSQPFGRVVLVDKQNPRQLPIDVWYQYGHYAMVSISTHTLFFAKKTATRGVYELAWSAAPPRSDDYIFIRLRTIAPVSSEISGV